MFTWNVYYNREHSFDAKKRQPEHNGYFERIYMVMEKTEKIEQVNEIKDRLEFFVKKLDEVNPEQFELKEIDHLLLLLDELEKKCGELLQ